MNRPVSRGTLALAGMAAGTVVGLGNGLWAGFAVGADVQGAVLAALLAGSVDALLGGVIGGVLEIVVRLAVWGRCARPVRWAYDSAAIVLGATTAAATVAAVVGTIDRRDRFLAGGVASLVASAIGIVGATLLPVLARLLSGQRAVAIPRKALDPAWLFFAPLALAVVDVVIMLITFHVRAPLGSARAARLVAVTGGEAALLPALLVWAERLHVGVRLRWVVPAALLGFGGPLLIVASRSWANHLRFLPWTDILAGSAIAVAALMAVLLRGRWLPSRSGLRGLVGVAGAVLSLGVVLAASESEPARKITTARAGLVGPVLAAARRALDRDHDGYARLLGGGDCDDGDPTVHPGVLDFPDDGVDQDCDGSDATASVLVPPPFVAVPEPVPRDLSLLLVTIDTVRADHLGCYGYHRPTSPEIDRLASEGALFLNGWAHAPSTRYSMPAIASGRWPTAITWDESIWWPRMARGVRTIAEALKATGYFTAAFYSYDYFSLADRRGFERGIDLYRADRAVLHQAVNGPMESHGSSSREMADDTIAFLDSHTAQKFFLWVHFYDPHLSYEPHAEAPSFGTGRMDLYDGEIRFTDMHLGRVFDRLKTLGLWDRTAIIVTGDHGEGFGEHGVTEHGFDLYAAQTKVPLIVRVPGLAPRRVSQAAGHVDLAPTLLNLARAPQDPAFLGRSLLPELSGASGSAGAPLAVFQEVTSERGKKRALVTEDWHLIWNWTPDNTTECYDRRADPDELRDLWGRSGDRACQRLKADLLRMVSVLSVPPAIAEQLKRGVIPPGAPAPRPAISLDAAIGDVATVVGVTLSTAGVVPGGEVELTILFDCKKAVTGGWGLFFHLMGPGGSFRNLDHVPLDGIMPPDRWRPGQRIVDRLRVAFPPGTPLGGYTVIVGLFRGGERLPVTPATLSDGNKAVRLATIQVR